MSGSNEEKIKKILTSAYEEIAVDSYEKISKVPNKKYNSMEEVLGKKVDFQRYGKIAAWGTVAAAMLAVVLLFNYNQQEAAKYAYVYIDVNPSIELRVNSKGNVMSCKAYNSDGEDIVGAKAVIDSVKNKEKLAVVMENVIKSIRDRGYFSGQYDSVLVSSANTEKLEMDYIENVVAEVSEYVQEKKMCNNVVYKEVEDYERAKKKGDKYGISPGKANYVEEVATSVIYTEEELAVKNIDAIFDLESESEVIDDIKETFSEETTVSVVKEAEYTKIQPVEETVIHIQEETDTNVIEETASSFAEEITTSNQEIIEETVSNSEFTIEEENVIEESLTEADIDNDNYETSTNEVDTESDYNPERLEIAIKNVMFNEGIVTAEFEKRVRWSENCAVIVTTEKGSIRRAELIGKGEKQCTIRMNEYEAGEKYFVYIGGIKRKRTDNYLNYTFEFVVPEDITK